MKKVLVAALLCTVSTFAAWDKFPVIEDGKGEVKIGFEQSRQSGETDGGQTFKIRYSPLAGLELMSETWGDVFGNYVLGVRYQVLPAMLSAGVDFGFPLGGGANWSFKPNVQFSMPLTSSLTLGTNFDLAIYTATQKYAELSYRFQGEEYSRGLDFTGGIELDFAFSEKSTFWVSFDAETGITRSEIDNAAIKQLYKDGLPLKMDDRQLTMTPAIGYIATLGNLDLGTYVSFTIFSEADGETPNVSTAVGVEASVKF
jgi:hypothetical protein